MQFKLLNIYAANTGKPESKLLGYAHVQIDYNMKILMNIFRNQNGGLFLKFPSQKIGEAYMAHIEFINVALERDITAALIEEVGNKMGKPKSPPVHAQTDFVTTGTSNEDFPF